jgi:hypothetical protein
VAGLAFPGVQEDPLTLAVLTLQALSAGITMVGIVTDLTNPDHGLVFAFSEPVDITTALPITIASSAIPEPATLLLLSTALPGLLGYRWRQASRNA